MFTRILRLPPRLRTYAWLPLMTLAYIAGLVTPLPSVTLPGVAMSAATATVLHIPLSPTATATLRPTRTPAPSRTRTPPPTPTPPLPDIAAYRAYRVQAGDTLESMSRLGGSTPDALMRYNRLTEAPQAGRELILPQLVGQTSILTNTQHLMVVRGNTQQRWVALTLDCGGENKRAHDILATLRAANVRITFFLLGSSIINDPNLLEQMVADGHELASHSYTHADFTTLTDEQIADELWRTEVAVQDIVGPGISIRPYFRFPYGAYDRRTLRAVIANGYLPIHWTLDSLDAFGEPKTPAFLVERLTTGLPPDELPGAILLGHCIGSTADALPGVLDGFAAAGIEVRTLSEVLGR